MIFPAQTRLQLGHPVIPVGPSQWCIWAAVMTCPWLTSRELRACAKHVSLCGRAQGYRCSGAEVFTRGVAAGDASKVQQPREVGMASTELASEAVIGIPGL